MKKALLVLAIVLTPIVGVGGAIVLESLSTKEYVEPEMVKVAENRVEPTKGPEPPTADRIFELVNEERAKVGVEPLKKWQPAMESALFKSEDMAKRNYFDHKDSTGSYNGLDKLKSDTGSKCHSVGENIDRRMNRPSAEEIVQAWMDSEAHRSAILSPEYTLSGVGVNVSSASGLGETHSTQHFCQEA